MVAGINGASNSPQNKKKTKNYDPKTGNLETSWMPKPPKKNKKIFKNNPDGSIPGRFEGESLQEYNKRRNQGLKDAMNNV